MRWSPRMMAPHWVSWAVLKAQGLAGIVPISGQDATADGCNSIVKGEQTVTVYKDIRLLAPAAVDMMDALLKGQAIRV